MNVVLSFIAYAMPSVAFALGGGRTIGPEASKADTTFIHIFITALVLIAIISRLKK